MEILDAAECIELLRQVPVGRIGITMGALPVILPVNFVVMGDALVFRTSPGTKLAAATSNGVVAFEIDSYEDDGRTGWSVLVQGVASEMTDPAHLEEALALPVGAWALGSRADHVVQIEPRMISGRRFSVRDDAVHEPTVRHPS